MAKHEFEKFKQEIKEWLDTHTDEYDRFVVEINDKSAPGLYKIFNVGVRLAPKLMRRYQKECHGDLADERQIQNYVADTDTASLLVNEFRNLDKDSIIPAMLAWLYYGKCYETMVNQLEAEANNPKNNFIEQKIAAIMIRVVIKSSIRNKMRTKEDWENFKREKKAIEEGNVMETCIEELETVDESTTEISSDKGQQSSNLSDYLLGDKEVLLKRIKLRVSTQHTGTDLARLYFALQEERLLSRCDVTTFHRLLGNELPNCNVKSVRNLQIAIKKLNDSTNKGKIKDCGMERTYINEWRSYLTKAD
mgnify:CR=1 FL=1